MARLLPKLSAPTLHAHVVEPPMIAGMGALDSVGAHWLFAGAGAGKTQGVRFWLDRIQRPYAWVQLEPRDQDALGLLHQLCQAMSSLFVPGAQLPELFPRGLISLDRHCEFVWDAAICSLERDSVLVLDDAHVIEQWREHPVLHHVLTRLHPQLHVVVVSRSEIPDSYAREVVNREVQLLGPKYFSWGVNQVRAWLTQRWGMLEASEQLVSGLLQISQGCAGILALLDVHELKGSEASLEHAARQIDLCSLMESSLLTPLSGSDLEALRWLACLGSFPEAWLERFCFSSAVRTCIRTWTHDTSVMVRLEHSDDELRFHPLLAEILRGGTPQLHVEHTELRSALIDACAARGRCSDAVELARQAGDWNRYWRLVEHAGLVWIQNGQLELLSKTLDDVPCSVLDQFAGSALSLFRSAVQLHKNPAQAYRHGIKAVSSARAGPHQSHEVWACALELSASSVVAGGQSLALLEFIADELKWSLSQDWFDRMSSSLRLRALKAGVISSMLAREILSLDLLFRKLSLALDESEDVELQADVVAAMMRVVALHGYPQFYEQVAQHLTRLESIATSPTAKTAVFNAKSSQYLALGRRADCVEAARATLAGYSDQTPSVWRIEVLCIGTYGCLAGQNLEEARQLCGTLERLTKSIEYRSVAHHWHLHAGAIAAHDGALEDAQFHFEQSVLCSDMYGYPFMQVIARSCLIVIALERGQPEVALRALLEGDAVLENCHMPLAWLVQAGSRAYFAMAARTSSEAAVAYEVLFEAMERSNNYALALDILPQYPRFLRFAFEQKVRTDLARAIIARAHVFPSRRPHPDWPSLYSVSVLGGFDITINGRSERARFASSGRRFELLTLLLWKGAKGVSHDFCVRHIWAYIVEEKRQMRAMKSAIRRLRQDLGRDDAILDVDGKVSLNPDLWSYDAWDLELQLREQHADSARAALVELERGFVGPTSIPESFRYLVPRRGGVDLGPEPLLRWLPLDNDSVPKRPLMRS